jgi:hypothetical protein
MSDRGNLPCTNCGEYAGSDIADEIERLREALASIVLIDLSYSTTNIARAALKGQP